jgi:hypothetical protein
MEQEETELSECAECGMEIDLHRDRYFAFSDQGFLCFECAIERGGAYDEHDDSWAVCPDVSSFADDRRPHP